MSLLRPTRRSCNSGHGWVMLGLMLLSNLAWGQWQQLQSPAGANSIAPGFVSDTDGTIIMTWLEKYPVENASGAATVNHVLKFARFEDNAFLPAKTIASGSDWFANWADTPALHIQSDATWIAHWLQKSAASTYAYDIMLTVSHDQGQSWTAAATPHRDGSASEHGFVSYLDASNAADSNGKPGSSRLIWLDGRNTVAHGDHANAKADEAKRTETGSAVHGGEQAQRSAMTLRSALVHADGRISPSQLLDDQVCDCCQTAAVNTSSGAVIAYRNRSDNEIRDIAVMRHSAAGWSEPGIAHEDGWQTAACPVNGPALAARGDQVALAWFTMADAKPRVHLGLSKDGGQQFDLRQTLSAGSALGRVQLQAYTDGWLLSWMDTEQNQAVIRLARLDTTGNIIWQEQIAGVSAQRVSGVPRIAVLADGRIIMAWTSSTRGTTRISTAVLRTDDSAALR